MAFTDLLHQSPNQGYWQFITGAGDDSIAVDGIKQTLIEAGWIQTGDVKATASVWAPFGLPCGDPPDVDVTNVLICSVGGVGIRWVAMPDFPPVAGWINIYPGLTMYDSALALAAALEGFNFSVVVTESSGQYTFEMTATALGTAGNGIRVEDLGSASWYVGSGLSGGGGWVLRSSSQQDLDITSANATRTTLTVTCPAQGEPASLRIYVEVDGVEPVNFNFGQAKYEVIAHNFWAMFVGTSQYHADLYIFNQWLFCGSLYVPQGLTGITGVGFILTGGNCDNTLGEGHTFANANTAVNAKQMTGGGFGQHGFSFAFYHYQNGSGGQNNLQTREEKSLLVPALVMMPATPLDGGADDSRVVGYLWDAFIDTGYQPPGTLVAQSGLTFCARLAQSQGAIGTVFILTNEIAPPEPAPVTPPSQRTWSGVVNATFFEVDWVSGNLFDPAMEGMTIELGSPAVAYTVSAVGPTQKAMSITTAYVNPGGGNSATNIPYSV